MSDSRTLLRKLGLEQTESDAQSSTTKRPESEGEDECDAFGYLRGLTSRALSLEFRLANGNRESFPYSWLGPARHDPSAGLLLRFTGDLVYLVLIEGSNLDGLLEGKAVNLIDRGILRHRVTWVREMEPEAARRQPEGTPTIDRIAIQEFGSNQALQAWLKQHAPAFLREGA